MSTEATSTSLLCHPFNPAFGQQQQQRQQRDVCYADDETVKTTSTSKTVRASNSTGTGAAAAVLSNPTIFELTWDIFGDRGYRHSIHCLWNGVEDRYGLPTTREIMGRVIVGLTDPLLSGRSRAVTVDISPPEAVVGQQHPTLLVEHVSGKILEAICHWQVYEDFVVKAIEDCFNGAISAVEVPVGVPVGNVFEESETVSSMSSGAMSFGSS